MIEAGHVFLARLGKTVLRPGGTAATEWLIDRANIRADTEILEVACNAGRTMIRLSKRFNCSVTGVDIDKAVLSKVAENIKKTAFRISFPQSMATHRICRLRTEASTLL